MLYRRAPDPSAIAALGMKPEDFDETVEVHPENWSAFLLFDRLYTQWRNNGYDPIGLDYNVLFKLMDRMKLSDTEWDWMFEDIRTMEQSALEEMRKD